MKCTPFKTDEPIGEPSTQAAIHDAPDVCDINGKTYVGWSVFNDSGFKVISTKGTIIVQRPGIRPFQSINPVP